MSFKDKVVIVTGASSGIGAATAVAFSEEGARVVIVGRNKTKLAAISSKCANSLVIQADITNDDEARRIIDETVEQYGRTDILVNNAGATVLIDIFEENIMDAYDSVMKVNLRAAFRLTSLAIPHLIKTKGNIVNISSVGSSTTQLMSQVITYSVSKAALTHFGACLAADLAPHGIRVNTISPGPVATDFLENCQFQGKWDDFKSFTALDNVSKPEEIAHLILFVASDKAKSVTGSNYILDNGLMIKRY